MGLMRSALIFGAFVVATFGAHAQLLWNEDGVQSGGQHSIIWDATDYPSGVYFAQLQTGNTSKIIKMVLLR
jgi:hypothetical protein